MRLCECTPGYDTCPPKTINGVTYTDMKVGDRICSNATTYSSCTTGFLGNCPYWWDWDCSADTFAGDSCTGPPGDATCGF